MNRRNLLAGLPALLGFRATIEGNPVTIVTDVRLVQLDDDEFAGVYLEKQLTDLSTGESKWARVEIETRDA
jgi:hypothetical protein